MTLTTTTGNPNECVLQRGRKLKYQYSLHWDTFWSSFLTCGQSFVLFFVVVVLFLFFARTWAPFALFHSPSRILVYYFVSIETRIKQKARSVMPSVSSHIWDNCYSESDSWRVIEEHHQHSSDKAMHLLDTLNPLQSPFQPETRGFSESD